MEWMEAVVLAAVVVGAIAQSSTGMGFSLVAAPAFVAALGPREGVATVLVLAAMSSVVPLARDGRHGRPLDAVKLLVPVLVATPLIGWALRRADTSAVSVGAGVGVLIGVGLLAAGVRWAWLRGTRGALVAGTASATLNVVGGVGGPPIGLYAANAGWDPPTTRGTLSMFFIVQNLVTAAVVGFVLPGWREVVALAVGVAIGMVLGTRMPAPVIRAGVLAISAVGGVSLVVHGL